MGVYFSPPNVKDVEGSELFSQIEIASKQSDINMCGFNYANIDWANGIATKVNKNLPFLKCIPGQFHGTDGKSPNEEKKKLLDLLISNLMELITDRQVRDNLDNSSHGVITSIIS